MIAIARLRKKLKAKFKANFIDSAKEAKMTRIYDRREKYLFTFFYGSSIHYHIKHIKKEWGEKIGAMSTFIIHNIRKITLRSVK